ncbi:MAG: response regulator, partial [Pseudomonadota bacterium]
MSKTKTCLIVDDSHVVRRVIQRIVENLDIETLQAEDGSLAVEACEKNMPDVILLDWKMPNMDGLEFVKTLRGMKGGDKPKVVFCSTEQDEDSIRQAKKAGADE